MPIGDGPLHTFRFRRDDDTPDDHELCEADERMLRRLLQVAKGWPRHGWLCGEAESCALRLLWTMQNAGQWGVRIYLSHDEAMFAKIQYKGRRGALRCGFGDPIEMDSVWYQDDDESGEEYQERLGQMRPRPSVLAQALLEGEETEEEEEEDDDDDEDDEEKLEPAEWVAENSEKVNDALEEQLVAFFDSSVLVENGISMFDFQRMNMMNMGIISKATIIIDGGNWS